MRVPRAIFVDLQIYWHANTLFLIFERNFLLTSVIPQSSAKSSVVIINDGILLWDPNCICKMGADPKCTILVTGFGPFDVHMVNASWEAVKELQKLWANSVEFPDVKLVAEEIPVSYNYVSTHIPQLWKKHNPSIVLHVGVSHKAESLTIECHACSNGYIRSDVCDKCPDETNIECNVLETGIDIKELCNNVNKNFEKSGCKACFSHDAGRYLCEYIFYQSLSIEPTKTLFVHVPDFNKYSSIQTANGLYDILRYLIRNFKLTIS